MATLDSDSETGDGESPISSGFLGRGKIISSCTTVGPNLTEGGDTPPNEKCTNDTDFSKCNTGTAP